MFMLKNSSDPELSEANFDARLLFNTVAQKYSANDVSIILFTDEKILQWPRRETHRMTATVRTCVNQQERRRDKAPATQVTCSH